LIAAEDGSQIDACRTRESEICTNPVLPPKVEMKRVPCVEITSEGGAANTSLFEEDEGPSYRATCDTTPLEKRAAIT
jgi:hypothetical protein